jgi:hypothetical protein
LIPRRQDGQAAREDARPPWVYVPTVWRASVLASRKNIAHAASPNLDQGTADYRRHRPAARLPFDILRLYYREFAAFTLYFCYYFLNR